LEANPTLPAEPTAPPPTTAAAPAAVVSAAPPAAPPSRPDHIPEKFWRDGSLAADDLAKSYVELEKKLGTAAADAVAKADRERLARRPEKPEDYVFTPAEGMVPDHLVILDKAPGDDFSPEEGKRYFVLDPADPLAAFWRDHCHRTGLPPDEFAAGIVRFAEFMGDRVPTAAEREAEVRQRIAALGPDGERRATVMHGQLKTMLGNADAAALDAGITTPAAFQALEKIMAQVNGARFSPPTAGTPVHAAPSEKDILNAKGRAMSMPHGPERSAALAEVEASYRRLFTGTVRF